MADYKIPNLCGASVQFNALQSKFDDMINSVDIRLWGGKHDG